MNFNSNRYSLFDIIQVLHFYVGFELNRVNFDLSQQLDIDYKISAA